MAGTMNAGRLAAMFVAGLVCLACSTGDPDPDPADTGGRIQRTTARVDSQLNQAREHIRTIDSIGGSGE